MTGFDGDGTVCTDIDECNEETDNCGFGKICENTSGSYECKSDSQTIAAVVVGIVACVGIGVFLKFGPEIKFLKQKKEYFELSSLV